MENKNEELKLNVVSPPEHIFFNRDWTKMSAEEQTLQPGMAFYPFDRLDYPPEGGIHVYFKGLLHPSKGFPFPEALDSLKHAKMQIRTVFRSIAQPELKLSWLAFAILPWNKKIKITTKILEQIHYAAEYSMIGFYLHDRYLCPAALATKYFIWNVLMEIGVPDAVALDAGRLWSAIVDYDDAYRYRLQDAAAIVSALDVKKNPRQAIKKILQTLVDRENDQKVKDTFQSMQKAINLIMLHPRIWRAIAAHAHQIENMHPDKADRYHMLKCGGYKYDGMEDSVRFAKWKEVHGGKAPRQIILNAQ